MLRCAPNPLLGSTLIPFAMARPGRARLTVVDAQGRRLRELVLADLAERVAAGHEPRD
jgi:hypothetical protein